MILAIVQQYLVNAYKIQTSFFLPIIHICELNDIIFNFLYTIHKHNLELDQISSQVRNNKNDNGNDIVQIQHVQIFTDTCRN